MTEEASFALLLKPDGKIEAAKADIGQDALKDRVAHLRKALTFAEGLQPFDIEASNRLYRELLAPLDQTLAELDHVAMIADGPLMSLPAPLLVREPGTSYSNTSWLGEQTALSMIGSIEAFVAMRRDLRPSLATQAFAGIGDPILAGTGGTSAAISRAAESAARAVRWTRYCSRLCPVFRKPLTSCVWWQEPWRVRVI